MLTFSVEKIGLKIF